MLIKKTFEKKQGEYTKLNEMKTGLIIQARLGSTRLPGKMLAPFSGEKSILELLIMRLKKHFEVDEFVIATTTSKKDDPIVLLCSKLGVNCFRGDENNVLDRFIKAAEKHNFSTIVRICADNPFLLMKEIQLLIENFDHMAHDYQSFSFESGTPVIKSHIGLFGEITTLETLKKVATRTTEELYCEHVTNYIYANKDNFRVNFLVLSSELKNREDIRLTVDTKADFELTQKLYQEIDQENFNIKSLLKAIDNNEQYREIMTSEIKRNTK